MTDYYKHEEFVKAKKQRDYTLWAFYVVLALFVAYCVWAVWYYLMLPYNDPRQLTIRIVTFIITGVFTVATYIYFATVYRYAKLYYKLAKGIEEGLTETMQGEFLGYFDEPETKNGIECKSMRFEVASIKNDEISMERKVLVPFKKDFPTFEKGDIVTFVTHANILLQYEIVKKSEKVEGTVNTENKGPNNIENTEEITEQSEQVKTETNEEGEE